MDLTEQLIGVVGAAHVLTGEDISDDYTHDEAITLPRLRPGHVVRPAETSEVAAVLRIANEHRVPVTGRGAGTGMSGAAIAVEGGILVSFERMNQVLEIDEANHMAVVQPGVTLDELDKHLAPRGLVYPVFPGEYSASLGGNVNTNAGGMRAVKYGVTRHHVIGLEAVLATGDVIRTGGKIVKTSTGYDLTQLVVGSEGTLALVTEATLRLYPRTEHQATVLAPFATLDGVTEAIPRIVASGVGPLILEYIDMMTMAAMSFQFGIDLGIPEEVKSSALAYLVVMMEQTHADRLDSDVEALAELVSELGALDVYVLPAGSATQLIDAREKAFWVAKSAGADEIIDIVVPRASVPEFMRRVSELAQANETLVAGCGHAGDGNVHMSVFQKDPETLAAVMGGLFGIGMDLGGAISGEHGLGTEKKKYFMELEDPVKIDLMRGIKAAFDPNGILNPGKVFD